MEYSDAHGYADERGLLLERHEHFTETQPGVWIADGVTPPSKIVLRGQRNLLLIGTGADCTGAEIVLIGDDSLAVIGAHSTLRAGRVRNVGSRTLFWLGALTTTAELQVSVTDDRAVVIGEEGMFSNRVVLATGDGHPIYRASTGERINASRDVEVGRHVWVGRDVRFSKGAVVGADSIIGQGSLVTGTKCSVAGGLYAGSPAVARDTDVTWSRMDAESWDEMMSSARHQDYLAKVAALRDRC